MFTLIVHIIFTPSCVCSLFNWGQWLFTQRTDFTLIEPQITKEAILGLGSFLLPSHRSPRRPRFLCQGVLCPDDTKGTSHKV